MPCPVIDHLAETEHHRQYFNEEQSSKASSDITENNFVHS